MSERFRFRPRFVLLALSAPLVGAILIACGWMTSGNFRGFAFITGTVGLLIGPLYFLSPAWHLAVVIDELGLEVVRGRERRFRLEWDQIVRVVVGPQHTLFVDGGDPERCLLVPGPGAQAPYDLEDKPALCRSILARVAGDRVIQVDSLAAFARKPRS